MPQPAPATRLYWSIGGEVACAVHAPDTKDPRWVLDGWTPVPTSTTGYLGGFRYQCQHCAGDGRAVYTPKELQR